jgi:hypothetical protein
MIVLTMVLGLVLQGADGARVASSAGAADQITLRDGTVVKGLVLAATTGPRGSVEFLVRRAWVDKNLTQHLQKWQQVSAPATRLAVAQRRKRLEAWRRERSPNVGPDDRVILWIDRELARPGPAGEPEPSTLLKVRLPRTGVHGLDRRTAPQERLLRLAWLCKLPDPESMPLGELKNALESRGYDVDQATRQQPAALDRLLPPTPEPELTWLARRAATELAVDSDLRFLRFQDTILPDAGGGQPLGNMGLSTAVSELKRLLDLDPGPKADPLADKLRAVGSRGRVGAVVTRLEIQPDMSTVTVESTLWVREGQRWSVFGSRNAVVRPDELGREAGKNLAEDPQVKGAFQIVEMLGLGAVPAELKERSLRIGAATAKALGMARSAFNQDLDQLALPVLEPERDARPNPDDANPAQRVPR